MTGSRDDVRKPYVRPDEPTSKKYTQRSRASKPNVQRAKVASASADLAAPKSAGSSQKSSQRSCTRCRESKNCVKVLNQSLSHIEELVNSLTRSAQQYLDDLNVPMPEPTDYPWVTDVEVKHEDDAVQVKNERDDTLYWNSFDMPCNTML